MSSANPKKRSGGNNKSPVSYAAKLHRIHAGAASSRLEFSEPIAMTWRGEGGPPEIKTAVAHRLATCWNVLEGIPTAALLDGALRKICDAVEAGDLDAAQRELARFDRKIDRTNGRLHDCPGCLGSTSDDSEDEMSADQANKEES